MKVKVYDADFVHAIVIKVEWQKIRTKKNLFPYNFYLLLVRYKAITIFFSEILTSKIN